MRADKTGKKSASLMRLAGVALLALTMLSPQGAKADCTTPAGVEADMYYNTTYKRVQFCDGTNWINMGVSFAGNVDNLGNHTATQDLAMGGFAITGAGAITGTSFTGSGSALTALNASNLGSGTIPNARFPATLPAASGVNLTSLNASNLASGTVPTARLGSGTADGTTYLRGDGTWAAVSAGAGDDLGNHTTTANIRLGGALTGNWLSGDGGNEGITVDGNGRVRMDYTGSTYDIWLQGGPDAVAGTRNLALAGREDTDTLYLNFGSDYAGGVVIGGPITITAGALSDNSILTADIAPNAVTNTEIANATIVATTKLSATGTKSSATFLRGDNTWATPASTMADGVLCGLAKGGGTCATFTSVETCNGASIVTTCPSGYTALEVQTAAGSPGSCLRFCSKN